MCGRTSITVSKKILIDRYKAKMEEDFKPTFNAAPSQLLPIIRNTNPKIIELARWGFLPKWMKDKKPTGFINTKAETALEKPSFKMATLKQRCLIPADGFFEWDTMKQPYYFRREDHDLFSFAGIWEEFKDEQGNNLISYSIITTEANTDVSNIHNRMPLILSFELEHYWLDNNLSVDDIKKYLSLPSTIKLYKYPVSKLVNKAENNIEDIIKPISI